MMEPRDIYDGIRQGLAVASVVVAATLISLAAVVAAAVASVHILSTY